MKKFFLDSSIWIDHFTNQRKESTDLILQDEHLLLTSILSLYEVKKRLLKLGIPKSLIKENLRYICKQSFIFTINKRLLYKAVDLSLNHHLATVDSIIYTSALTTKSHLYSSDNDFRGLNEVTLIA